MAKTTGYSDGKKVRTSNSSKGVSYSDGKNSSIALGIGSGKSGSSRVKVGYSDGKATNAGSDLSTRTPDPKGAPPFKPGGRA